MEESFYLEKKSKNPNESMILKPELLEEVVMNEEPLVEPSNKKSRKAKVLKENEESFSESIKNEQSSKSSRLSKQYKRGPYRAYGISLKQEAIKMMEEEDKSLKEVSNILRVPTKNIKRWMKVGALRKKGIF